MERAEVSHRVQRAIWCAQVDGLRITNAEPESEIATGVVLVPDVEAAWLNNCISRRAVRKILPS
jgi:hypothetical protein